MFLVKDRRLGMNNYVFTHMAPRTEGYRGDVIEGVTLDYDMNAIHHWPDGLPAPNPQLGVIPKFRSTLRFSSFRRNFKLRHSRTKTPARRSLFIPGPTTVLVIIQCQRSMRSR